MAYISEINYRDQYVNSSGIPEYVEIVLTPDEFARADDFDVDFYRRNASVGTSYNLGDLTPIFSNGHYVYVIYENMALNGNNGSNYAAVALGENGSLLHFYDIAGNAAVVMPTTGVAAGATPIILAHPATNAIQIDANGVVTNGPASPGEGPVCFVKGTLIACANGERFIEDLRVGDLVVTADRGLQPIRWIGDRHIKNYELNANPKLYPVKLKKDSIREGLPKKDLSVSPHHRMLVQSAICERMLGNREVFIEAKHLAPWMGFEKNKKVEEVHYYHLLFDHHEVVYAEGTPCESLYLGESALSSITEKGREEIETIFPEITSADYRPDLARVSPSNKRQKELMYRHAKNLRPLIELES